jgi:superfamily I DNA/RNA helicase
METGIDPANKYARAEVERSKHVREILECQSRKKVVVGGPGTGKTLLFREILKGKGNCLTLTFVNALVEDLSLELNGLSEVRTLHSFARSLLSRLTKKDIRIVPKLPEVIKEDAVILLRKEVDFNRLFNERKDESEHIKFYMQRKNYYGDCYGYSDVIFAAVKYLELHRDKVPGYDQVLVDEFQDFNRLEVSLIELLSEESPVLVAGDDDQALYDFKSASTEHIRSRHGDKALGYEPFNLPYCSRCTRVIVQAANDIIESAANKGCLKGRIDKPFVYFDDKEKDRVSDENPTISYDQVWATKIPWAIEKEIGKVARDLRAPFSVLIISPYNIQSRQLTTALKNKGFEKLESTEKRPPKEPTLLDGLKLLVIDGKGSLGWRIVAKCLLEEKAFKSVLEETAHENARSMYELVGNECRNQIKEMLRVLKKLARSEPIDENSVEALKKMDLDPYNIMRDILAEELDLESHRLGDPAVRKIPIKATTIQSSKGLSADYVFITHFDDQYLIENEESLTDREVCNFLVALTRARKKVFLISSTKREPTFLKWIQKETIASSLG